MKANQRIWLFRLDLKTNEIIKKIVTAINIEFRICFDAVAPMKIPSHRKAEKPAIGINNAQN